MPRPAPSTRDPSRSCPPGFVRSSWVSRRCVPATQRPTAVPTALDIRCLRWRAPTPVLPSHGRLRVSLLRHVQQVSAAARRGYRAADGLVRRGYRALFGVIDLRNFDRTTEEQATRQAIALRRWNVSAPCLSPSRCARSCLTWLCRVVLPIDSDALRVWGRVKNAGGVS